MIAARPLTSDRVTVMKVSPTFLCGGTEGQFSALAQALDPVRFDVRCACLRRQGDLDAGLQARGIPVREYPITSFFKPSAAVQQARFARDLGRGAVDIVHTYNFYGNVFAIPPARVARVPVVVASIRDCGPYLSPAQKRVQREICRLADCVLVNANAVRDWLIQSGYHACAIAVIRNGVDLQRFQTRRGSQLRAELGWPAGRPIVGVVSRLVPLKGLERFLEAASLIAADVPDVGFVVVGEAAAGGEAFVERLRTMASHLGIADRTCFAGRRTDVPDVLGAFTVAVMPSLSEGLSNVLLESMAAGVPVVATTVGGTPEVVTDDVTGVLVPPDNAQAIAAGVARLLRHPDLAAAIGRAARRLIEGEFSLERAARRTEQLYLDLVAKGRHRANERQRVSPRERSGATGVPASERVGGSAGAGVPRKTA